MPKNTRWTSDDFKNKGLIETADGFVKSSTLVDTRKVEKFPGFPLNKKIKNATKSEVDGVKFDSNLEKYMYDLLKGAGITFDFQVEYLLQDKFRYRGEAVRAIVKVVDFWLPGHNMIIDTKGYANDVSPIKHKMLKSVLKAQGLEPEIIMPKNKKECELLVNKLVYE